MTELVLHPTSTAQWLALVHEAEAACGRRLDDDLESYLVILLQRFAAQPQLSSRIMALEYLEAISAMGSAQRQQLQAVGDQCLLLSGLFPRLAQRRLVRVSYFVRLGRTAYDQLASIVQHRRDRLYSELAQAFVPLVDVLQAVREMNGAPAMTPLQAMELWQDTGSDRALRTWHDNLAILGRGDGRQH